MDSLPEELKVVTKRNYETAFARCSKDEEREKELQGQEFQEMCDEGNEEACEFVEDLHK